MVTFVQQMITYAERHGDLLLQYLSEHLFILAVSFILSYGIACIITAIVRVFPITKGPVNGICNAIFAIPTLAMFALLIPYTGMGEVTAITTIVLYNQFSIVKNINQGFDGIDKSVVESAKAMGMSSWLQLWNVKIPLAMPTIVSGMKMCLIATLTMSTLAANIGAGGLGVLLFRGLSMKKWNQVAWGIVLTLVIGVIINKIMESLEEYTLHKSRGYGK